MARIKTYKLDDNVTGSDMWIGTDGNDASKTKNFSPTYLANYLNQNEVIDVSNSIRFTYDTIDSGKSRKSGTLSFATEIGAIVPINSLTTFILSKNTESDKLVSAFLNILPGTKIILQKSDYINIFGIFKVISVTQITLEPDFYTVVVEYISGYGSLEEDKDYIISLIDLQGAGGGNSTTTSNVTADLEVGGIEAQQVIPAGTDLQQFVEDLLTKTFNPILTGPSFSLTNNAGTREIGSSSAITLSFNFNRGSIVGNIVSGIWQPGAVQGFRAGASSSYTIDGVTQLGNTLSITPTLLESGNQFTGTVTYLTGIQPLDSKGNDFDDPLTGGTSDPQSTIVQGIYPYFYYKSSSPITASNMQDAIENEEAIKVVGNSDGTLSIPYNVVGEYMAIAYPNESTAKTKYFVSIFDQGALSDPTSPFDLGNVLNCYSPDSFWSNVPYRIHVSPILTNPGAIIELRNL